MESFADIQLNGAEEEHSVNAPGTEGTQVRGEGTQVRKRGTGEGDQAN